MREISEDFSEEMTCKPKAEECFRYYSAKKVLRQEGSWMNPKCSLAKEKWVKGDNDVGIR